MPDTGFQALFNPPLTNDERKILNDRLRELQLATDKRVGEGMPGKKAAFEAAKAMLGRAS